MAALFPHGGAPLATLTVSGFAFLIVGFVAMGSTLQTWYQKVFEQPSRGWRGLLCGNFVWSASVLVYFIVQLGLSGATGPTGSRLLVALVQFAVAIVSNHQTYGDIGTIMIFLSFQIGLGVVVHLGAVLGQMYNERRPATAGQLPRGEIHV